MIALISYLISTSVRIIWIWGLLILTTFLFLFRIKEGKSLVVYFIIQEVLNFLFLLSSSFNLSSILLIRKIGLSPFFFWIFIVVKNLSKIELVWFLTLQKSPAGILFIKLGNSLIITLLLLGVIIISFIILIERRGQILITLRRTGRRAFPLVYSLMANKVESLKLFLFYLLLFWLLIEERNWNRIVIGSTLILTLLSLPLLPLFLLKLYLSSFRFIISLILLLIITFTILIRFSYLGLLIKTLRESKKLLNRNIVLLLVLFTFLFL